MATTAEAFLCSGPPRAERTSRKAPASGRRRPERLRRGETGDLVLRVAERSEHIVRVGAEPSCRRRVGMRSVDRDRELRAEPRTHGEFRISVIPHWKPQLLEQAALAD